jgi:hypothetical protein
MLNTKFKTTKQNLIALVNRVATPETLNLIKTEIEDCKTLAEQIEWTMEAYFTYEQKYAIVKISRAGTWGLIEELDDDDIEYTDLWNGNFIKDWHEK